MVLDEPALLPSMDSSSAKTRAEPDADTTKRQIRTKMKCLDMLEGQAPFDRRKELLGGVD